MSDARTGAVEAARDAALDFGRLKVAKLKRAGLQPSALSQFQPLEKGLVVMEDHESLSDRVNRQVA